MGKDKVVRIMEQLTEEKNRNITQELAELRKKKSIYNGIYFQEFIGLSSTKETQFKEEAKDLQDDNIQADKRNNQLNLF